MFKLKSKKLEYAVCLAVLFLFILSSIPSLKAPVLDILKFPLSLISFVNYEAKAIIFSHRNLSQNESLKKQINLLKARLVAMQEIGLQNARLKKLLNFKEKAPYKVIASRVIARSADNWSSVIFIDKGNFHGIKAGQVVLSYLGLAGRVVEATKYTSKVLLANDPDFAVSSIVQRSRQEGLVSGTLGNFLLMKYLSPDAEVQLKDIVVTSGLTEAFPKGLIIGTVVEVGQDNPSLSRYCLIKPVIPFSSLEEVLVIVE